MADYSTSTPLTTNTGLVYGVVGVSNTNTPILYDPNSIGSRTLTFTAPTGFSVVGSPLTGTGTISLGFSAGYSLPTTASQTNWDTAYGWGDHAAAGYLEASDIVINGTAFFVTNTKPTTRIDGSALVDGDQWTKPTDNGDPGTAGEWVYKASISDWVSVDSNTLGDKNLTITAAGNSYQTIPVPSYSVYVERTMGQWGELGGGGTNPWSFTDYFTISVEIVDRTNTNPTTLTSFYTVTNAGGSDSTIPVVVPSTGNARCLRVSVPSKTNDPVNGYFHFSCQYRRIHP